jgi:hypothetical protein
MAQQRKASWLGPLVIAAAAVAFGTAFYFLTREDPNEGVNIKAEMNDAELTGEIKVAQFGEYKGPRDGEHGTYIVEYSTQYENGNRRVAKIIFADKMPYLTRTGHFVLYQYHREDGSLEHDKLVEPYTGMGCGVWTKERWRYFGADGKQLVEKYVRPDGTLGAFIDMELDVVTTYHADGRSFRLIQEPIPGSNNYTQVRYKKDGKTPWWIRGANGSTQVFFDLYGKPINKTFTSEAAFKGGFSLGAGDPPKLVRYDKFWREDGTLDYVQSWYMMYDKRAESFKDVIGSVTVYDATGKKPLRTYDLDKRFEGLPRYIWRVTIYYDDGTKLVTRYSEPDLRVNEQALDKDDKPIRFRELPASERYQRVDVDDVIFHGFDHDVWGNPDANEHDF